VTSVSGQDCPLFTHCAWGEPPHKASCFRRELLGRMGVDDHGEVCAKRYAVIKARPQILVALKDIDKDSS
jgi:hypothetical protein